MSVIATAGCLLAVPVLDQLQAIANQPGIVNPLQAVHAAVGKPVELQ